MLVSALSSRPGMGNTLIATSQAVRSDFFLLTVPLIRNIKQGSCEYRFQKLHRDPARKLNPRLPLLKL